VSIALSNNTPLAQVKMAFSKVDKDGSGILDASDIVDSYDASKHPEVIAGRMTEQQVFSEFLNNFDVGGVQDGKVCNLLEFRVQMITVCMSVL
jgi:hypothetical protein